MATYIPIAQARGFTSQTITWFGGLEFVKRVTFNDNSSDIIINQGNAVTEISPQLSEQLHKSASYPIPTQVNESNRKKWAHLKKIAFGAVGQKNPSDGWTNIDPETWEVNYSSIDRYYIDTPYNQAQFLYDGYNSTGCSPTAGSNLIMFYANSYPSLNPTNSQRDIVMALRTHMGTTQTSDGTGVTNFWNIDDGLQSYIRSAGYPKAIATNGELPDYSHFKTAIRGQNKPVLQSYWNKSGMGDHTLFIVGFKEFVRSWYESNSKYLVARNNWGDGTFNIYVKWGTWNASVMTRIDKID
ncbi:hypothetical protein [Paenibacillus sp. YYML68]|uniref:hypothetical protein n=1 Tax=Paenibacillus sp. YYML68 TaxID=2909250 RepID=UPI0024910006|nr:hypothetical protein [Paenibacillus sp. YYML68]